MDQRTMQTMISQLAEVCGALSRGDYKQARQLFDFTVSGESPPYIAALAEAFGLMLVKTEAREFHLENIVTELEQAITEQKRLQAILAKENAQLWSNLHRAVPRERMVGQSPAMQDIMRQAERICQVDATVLITGETGTGKGMLARMLHYDGPRAKGPFVSINCAAIPASLLESELFGIEKGVASGVNARMGRFEQANNGTIFLDEIGDMPLESQAKILHVIENRKVERVGGRQSIPVNIRIIAATHRNLGVMCEKALFRSDLYYRLNVISLHMPALRERVEDIPLLVRHFLGVCARRNPMAARGISNDALELFKAYHWPGNIRELENETERAALLSRNSSIGTCDLSPSLAAHLFVTQEDSFDAPSLPIPGMERKRTEFPEAHTPPHAQEQAPDMFSDLAPALENVKPVRSLSEMEEMLVRRALHEAGGNKTHAANILGISREGLRKMLKRLNITA
ncbi:sigma-54 dependent transcriptional regulator [Desulfovibrio sp. OttesenSCG-928-M14]|nr:sigma-54 dependent transcriptional regulator [Desulfovibrio sp. OttesenSCG-928-M14]